MVPLRSQACWSHRWTLRFSHQLNSTDKRVVCFILEGLERLLFDLSVKNMVRLIVVEQLPFAYSQKSTPQHSRICCKVLLLYSGAWALRTLLLLICTLHFRSTGSAVSPNSLHCVIVSVGPSSVITCYIIWNGPSLSRATANTAEEELCA